MKSAGEMAPRVRCCQRRSASTPQTRPSRRLDERLVDEVQLVLLEGDAEVDLQAQALERAPVGEVVVDLEPRPALLLGPRERDVGLAQEHLGRALLGAGDRDADRRRHDQALVGDLDGLAHRGEHVLGGREDLLVRGRLPEQHELVAGEVPRAGDAVGREVAHAGGHDAQDLVAGLVAVALVDEPQVVEVDEQHAQAPVVGPRLGLRRRRGGGAGARGRGAR